MKKNIYSEVTAVKSTNTYYNPISKKKMKLTVSNQKNYYIALNKLRYYILIPTAPVQKIVIDYFRGIIELYSNATTGKPSPDEIKEFFTKNFGNSVKLIGANLARFKYTEIEDIAAAIEKIILNPPESPKQNPQTQANTPNVPSKTPVPNAPKVQGTPAQTPITSSYEQPFSKNFKYFLEQYSHIISEENVNLPGVGDIEVPNSRTKFFEIENIAIRVRSTNTAYFYNLDTKELFTLVNGKVQPVDIKELPKLLGLTPTTGTNQPTTGTNQPTTGTNQPTYKTIAELAKEGKLQELKKTLPEGKSGEIMSKIIDAAEAWNIKEKAITDGIYDTIKNAAVGVQDKVIEAIKSTGITNIVDTKSLGNKAIKIIVPSGVTFDSNKKNYGTFDDKNNTVIISNTQPKGNHVILGADGKISFVTAKTSTNDSYNLIPRIGKLETFFEASENIIYKDIFNINEEEAPSTTYKYVLDKKTGEKHLHIIGDIPNIDNVEGKGWFGNFWKNLFSTKNDRKIKFNELIDSVNKTEFESETSKALLELFDQWKKRYHIVDSGEDEEKKLKKAIFDVILRREKAKKDIDAGKLFALIKYFDDTYNIDLKDNEEFNKYLAEKGNEGNRDIEISKALAAGKAYDEIISKIMPLIGNDKSVNAFKTKLEELTKNPNDAGKNAKDIINLTRSFLSEIPNSGWVKIYKEYLSKGTFPFPKEPGEEEGGIVWELKKIINNKISKNFEVLMMITFPKITKVIGDGIDMEKYYRMRLRNEFSYNGEDNLKNKDSQYTKTFNEIVAEMKRGKYIDMKLMNAIFNGADPKEATLDFFSRVFNKNDKLNEKLRIFAPADADQEAKTDKMDDNELLKKGGIFIGANDNWKRRAFTHEAILRFEETDKIDQDDVRRISDFTGTTPDFIRRKLFDKKSDAFRKKLKKSLEDNGLTKESLMGNKEGEEAATKKSKKEETVQTNTNPVIEKIIKKYKNGKILTDADDKARLLEELNNFNASLEVDRRFISKVLEIKKDEYNLAMEGVYTLINTFNKTPKELKGEKKAEVKKTEENKKEETGFKYINKKNGEIKLKKIGDRIKTVEQPSSRSAINTLIRQMGSAEEASKITDEDIVFIKKTLNIDDAEYKAILAAPNRSSLLDKTKLGLSLNDSYQPKNDLESFIFTEYFNIESKLKK